MRFKDKAITSISEAEWKEHVFKCLLPVVGYITSCFETEYRSEADEFYRGACVFDVSFLWIMLLSNDMALTDKPRNYPCLDNTNIIDGLKTSFKFIKEAAEKVTTSEVNVLQWHYYLKEQLTKKWKAADVAKKAWHVAVVALITLDFGGKNASLWRLFSRGMV
jgi:hypothetical protein